jgi:putative endopeptidase
MSERNIEVSKNPAEKEKTYSPREDFYLFVNQEWLEKREIPADEAQWGSFMIARDRTSHDLNAIAEAVQNHESEKGSNEQQVRDFFLSGIDMESRNRLGVEPLNDLRRTISNVTDASSALGAMAEMRLKGSGAFISAGIGEDDRNAGWYAFFIHQGGLGLPDRDYYLSDNEEKADVREKYKVYISDTFQMLGLPKAEADSASDGVYEIEHALAEASKPAAEARPIDENYEKYTLDEAKQEFPDIDWDAYFGTLGKPDIKDFVIQQPAFVKKVGEILQNTDIQHVKDYLELRLLDGRGSGLSQAYKDLNFDFNGKVLAGLKEQKPLWKTTVNTLDSTILTNAIGPLYCAEHFDLDDKAESEIMVEDVRAAAKERIAALDWMTPETQAKMLQKVDNIIFKMGFPQEWIDVSSIDVRPDTYMENLLRASEFSMKRDMARLEEPYDYSEWLMNPTEVNACSDLKREMTFPAAIHQPPFYDRNADPASNYGGLGAVIGHELTHFIDDEGCKYDLEGNVNDWWTDEDKKRFKKKVQKYIDYYDTLEANGLKVNGKLTAGENIADDGGLKIGYHALQIRLAREGKREIIDGMTPEQRFFIGWARVWASKMRPELAQQRILSDPHSPGPVRGNAVAIVPEFQMAFDVQPGEKMYIAPDDMPALW